MASGVGLNEAGKQVAAETDKEHGTTTKWTAVKKKVGTCTNSTDFVSNLETFL